MITAFFLAKALIFAPLESFQKLKSEMTIENIKTLQKDIDKVLNQVRLEDYIKQHKKYRDVDKFYKAPAAIQGMKPLGLNCSEVSQSHIFAKQVISEIDDNLDILMAHLEAGRLSQAAELLRHLEQLYLSHEQAFNADYYEVNHPVEAVVMFAYPWSLLYEMGMDPVANNPIEFEYTRFTLPFFQLTGFLYDMDLHPQRLKTYEPFKNRSHLEISPHLEVDHRPPYNARLQLNFLVSPASWCSREVKLEGLIDFSFRLHLEERRYPSYPPKTKPNLWCLRAYSCAERTDCPPIYCVKEKQLRARDYEFSAFFSLEQDRYTDYRH